MENLASLCLARVSSFASVDGAMSFWPSASSLPAVAARLVNEEEESSKKKHAHSVDEILRRYREDAASQLTGSD